MLVRFGSVTARVILSTRGAFACPSTIDSTVRAPAPWHSEDLGVRTVIARLKPRDYALLTKLMYDSYINRA